MYEGYSTTSAGWSGKVDQRVILGSQTVEGGLRSVRREPSFSESEDVSVVHKENMLDDSRFVYIGSN
jgi:hypothetical protein